MFAAELHSSALFARPGGTGALSAVAPRCTKSTERVALCRNFQDLPRPSVSCHVARSTVVQSPDIGFCPSLPSQCPVLSASIGDELQPLSEQALISDYQYALRQYRSLKEQIGEWQAAFAAAEGRQPTPDDAARQCGPLLAARYTALLQLRRRLMVELPRLRARMPDSHQAAAGGQRQGRGGGGQQQQQRGAGGRAGLRSSVNANSVSPGGSSGSHTHPCPSQQHPGSQQQPQQPPQVADSVATWLRADRYRRLHAAAARGAAAGTQATASNAVASAAVTVEGGYSQQFPANRPHQHKQQPQEHGQQPREQEGAQADGPTTSHPAGCLPYQPVIQLTPLEQRLGAAAQPGQPPLPPAASQAPQVHVQAAPAPACPSSFLAPPGASSSSHASSPRASLLEADAALAGDSRTRGALMAALRYRQTRSTTSGGSSSSSSNSSGRGAGAAAAADEELQAAAVGAAGAATLEGGMQAVAVGSAGESAGAVAGVQVQVQVEVGDVARVYGGGSRRAGAPQECFLVCP